MLSAPAPGQFGGVPGETLASVGLMTLLVSVSLAVWAVIDAAHHSDHPLTWALGKALEQRRRAESVESVRGGPTVGTAVAVDVSNEPAGDGGDASRSTGSVGGFEMVEPVECAPGVADG